MRLVAPRAVGVASATVRCRTEARSPAPTAGALRAERARFSTCRRSTRRPWRWRTALSENVAQHSASTATPPGNPLRGLRRELARLIVDSPPALMPRFEHFLDAVSVRTAHRLEPARAHLETAFESMTEPLLAMGLLDSKALERWRPTWSSPPGARGR